MKLLSFIRQRSFARFIMFDLADAARRLGWNAQWLDLEGRLYANVDRSSKEKIRIVAETIARIEQFNPDLIFSYGLEYLDRMVRPFSGKKVLVCFLLLQSVTNFVQELFDMRSHLVPKIA